MRIIVTGATSQIGLFLLPKFVEQGDQVFALSRESHESKQIEWLQGDLSDPDKIELPQADVLIHIGSLSLLPGIWEQISTCGIKRIIAFSSTSVFTKMNTSNEPERNMIESLKKAESSLMSDCQLHGIAWTLFRPTLIYGAGLDKNVEFIRSMILKYGFFPIVGDGAGLRQPVHAGDLAKACLLALANPASENRAYSLSGAEVLSYRVMVERIFLASGRKPRILSFPVFLVEWAVVLLRLLPRYRYLNSAMISRMQLNMAFSHKDATEDFGYSPRPFQP